MNTAARDWMKHAALLDAQPSNRRLVQQTTPRMLREAGLLDWPDARAERRIDFYVLVLALIATPIALCHLLEKI